MKIITDDFYLGIEVYLIILWVATHFYLYLKKKSFSNINLLATLWIQMYGQLYTVALLSDSLICKYSLLTGILMMSINYLLNLKYPTTKKGIAFFWIAWGAFFIALFFGQLANKVN